MTRTFRAGLVSFIAWLAVACATSHDVPRADRSAPDAAVSDGGGSSTDAGSASAADADLRCPGEFTPDALGCARWVAISEVSCTGTSTRMRDGRVLTVGECTDAIGAVLGAFLFDPSSATWSATRPPHTPRSSHSATMLADGRVLISGGIDATGALVRSTEAFDPRAEEWSSTGELALARAGHIAITIAGGVLVAGGTVRLDPRAPIPDRSTASVEIFDGARWRGGAPMNEERVEPTATLLADGRVLVAGSTQPSTAPSIELYDPAAGVWHLTERLDPENRRGTATLLEDGSVLLVGFDASPLLYRPSAGVVPTGPSTMPVGISGHVAVRTSGGHVLVVGGGGYAVESPAELYDPITRSWTRTSSPLGWYNIAPALRSFPAIALHDGRVLVGGAEVYERL
jgi:hypothetical protein